MNESNTDASGGGVGRDPALERLYREAATERPPAHLDAAILAAARREVDARSRPVFPMLRRWHVPVSIAAVVAVSVTLVILMREEWVMYYRDLGVGNVAKQEMARAPAPPPQANEEEVRAQSAPPAPMAPVPLLPESRDDDRPAMDIGKPAARSRVEPMAPPVSGAGRIATPKRPSELPVPSSEAGPSPLEAAPRRLAESGAAPSPSAAPQAGPAAGILGARTSGKERKPAWQGLEKEAPEKWLARIAELKKEGRVAEAEEMLSEFRRRFPSYPVPPAPSR